MGGGEEWAGLAYPKFLEFLVWSGLGYGKKVQGWGRKSSLHY